MKSQSKSNKNEVTVCGITNIKNKQHQQLSILTYFLGRDMSKLITLASLPEFLISVSLSSIAS